MGVHGQGTSRWHVRLPWARVSGCRPPLVNPCRRCVCCVCACGVKAQRASDGGGLEGQRGPQKGGHHGPDGRGSHGGGVLWKCLSVGPCAWVPAASHGTQAKGWQVDSAPSPRCGHGALQECGAVGFGLGLWDRLNDQALAQRLGRGRPSHWAPPLHKSSQEHSCAPFQHHPLAHRSTPRPLVNVLLFFQVCFQLCDPQLWSGSEAHRGCGDIAEPRYVHLQPRYVQRPGMCTCTSSRCAPGMCRAPVCAPAPHHDRVAPMMMTSKPLPQLQPCGKKRSHKGSLKPQELTN